MYTITRALLALSLISAAPLLAQFEKRFAASATKTGTTTIAIQSDQSVPIGSRKTVFKLEFYYKTAGAGSITLRYAGNAASSGTSFSKSRTKPTSAATATVVYDADSNTSSGEFIVQHSFTAAAEATIDLSDYELPLDKAFLIVVGGTPGASTYLIKHSEKE